MAKTRLRDADFRETVLAKIRECGSARAAAVVLQISRKAMTRYAAIDPTWPAQMEAARAEYHARESQAPTVRRKAAASTGDGAAPDPEDEPEVDLVDQIPTGEGMSYEQFKAFLCDVAIRRGDRRAQTAMKLLGQFYVQENRQREALLTRPPAEVEPGAEVEPARAERPRGMTVLVMPSDGTEAASPLRVLDVEAG